MTDGIDVLEKARRDVGLTIAELWLRYFTLGGMSTSLEMEAVLYGALVAAAHDRDVLAVALNERYAELGGDHPVPYTGDEPDGEQGDWRRGRTVSNLRAVPRGARLDGVDSDTASGRQTAYYEMADWWPLFSGPEDYGDEARRMLAVLRQAATRPVATVLELGAGGGNSASHLRDDVQLTLTDLSPGMSAVSRRLNPGCEHVIGDMRDLRLGRRFDAVMVHDAVMYLTTRDELAAMAATAFEHCEPGGAVVLVPDWPREEFRAATEHDGSDDPETGRGLRYLMWIWDPDPADDEVIADFAFLLRHPDGDVETVHDRHRWGLFDEATWLDVLTGAGFTGARRARDVDGDAFEGAAYVAHRPEGA